MFYTNAFVNLNLPATVLSLLSRTWRLYLYLCPLCISTSHRWQSAVCCCCWRWRSSPQHSIWPTSQLLLIPGQTSGAGYREIPPFSNILWSLWLIPNWLCAGKFVWRHECETWLCTLESRHWGWVSERKCVLNITDIMMVTCLKMDVTSLNMLQSQLGLAFLWWVAMPRRV